MLQAGLDPDPALSVSSQCLTMAAKEDLYSKILPRRLRQNRPGSVKCGSNLDVLLSMGFPRPRA